MTSESKSLKDIYVSHLKDLYCAENQITETLPNLINFVNSSILKKDLEYQLHKAENRVKQLDRIFEILEKNRNRDRNERMESYSQIGKLGVFGKNISSDQMGALVASRDQHDDTPQVSSPYVTVRLIAELLGEKEAVDLITQVLEEEKATNVNLTEIGMMVVQIGALQDSVKEADLASP